MKKALFALLIVAALIGTVYAVPGNGNGKGNGNAFGLNREDMRNAPHDNGLHLGLENGCHCGEGNGDGGGNGNGDGNGLGNIQFLPLIGKDSSDWSHVPENGVGMMAYKGIADNVLGSFTFYGSGLTYGTQYALISYDEPWPGEDTNVLGAATANIYGDVQITGTDAHLVCNDYSAFTTGDYTTAKGYDTGTKIWLVPLNDLSPGEAPFDAWNPDQYLFETDLINKGCIPNTAVEGP